jgi:hypothetical protein
MKSLFFSSAEVESDDRVKYRLNYFILVEDVSGENGDLILESYGIKVVIANEDKEEKVEISNITTNALKIENLLKIFYNNMVTPATAYDIVSDWI